MKKNISMVAGIVLIIGIIIGARSYALKYMINNQQIWNITMKYKQTPSASGKIKFSKDNKVELINSDSTVTEFKYKTEFNRLTIISKDYGDQIFIVKDISKNGISGKYQSTVTKENGKFKLTK